MESSVEIRPKQSVQFLSRIRNQLLFVFLTIVGFVIIIGILSFNSQTVSRSTAEQLLGSDADFIQAAVALQGDISELRRLEEQYVLSVQTIERIDTRFAQDREALPNIESARVEFIEPWNTKFQVLLANADSMSMDSMEEMDDTLDITVLGPERLGELQTTFESIVALHEQRDALVKSTDKIFRIDVWMDQEQFAPFQIFTLQQSIQQLKYIQTGDASHISQYRTALQEIDPIIENAAEFRLSSFAGDSFRDWHNLTASSLQSLNQIDRSITQQREVYRILLDSADEFLRRSVAQTLATQTARQNELSELNQNTTLGIVGMLMLAGVAAMFYMLTSGRRTINQVKNLEKTIGEIRKGNYRARARVLSNDETGFVAGEMNRVLDSTFALMQSRDEQDAIQDAILQFMEDVNQVADGDLTIRARGTHALTNDVALSFNQTVLNLHDIIEQIQDTTTQVSAATGQVRTTAQELVEGSESQSDYIIDTSAAVDEMAISIQHVSESSLTSTSVSEQARQNARAGTEAVNETIAGLERVQKQVELASGQLVRLSDSSQGISTSIELINDVADRTSVLALNATIRALAAGNSGRGFTVVAREIESLSAQAAQAAQRVSQLSSQMQLDANKTIEAMDATQSRVQTGLQVAENASLRLGDIERVSERLAEVIREISHAAQQQARSSETVARSMNEIANVTQQTASGTFEAMTSIDNLAQLAEQLRHSIALFKLHSHDKLDTVPGN